MSLLFAYLIDPSSRIVMATETIRSGCYSTSPFCQMALTMESFSVAPVRLIVLSYAPSLLNLIDFMPNSTYRHPRWNISFPPITLLTAKSVPSNVVSVSLDSQLVLLSLLHAKPPQHCDMNLRFMVLWYIYAPIVWSYIGLQPPGDHKCISIRFELLTLT